MTELSNERLSELLAYEGDLYLSRAAQPHIRALITELLSLRQSHSTGVVVKELEWSARDAGGCLGKVGNRICYTIEKGIRHWRLYEENQIRYLGAFDTEAEARSAAQADYERRILSALSPVHKDGEPVTHPDDEAVDRFAAAMKAKLAKKRAEGRGGWENKDEYSAAFLSSLLHGHVIKGDPVDVANLAMMLHQRGECILQTPNSAEYIGPDFVFSMRTRHPKEAEVTVTEEMAKRLFEWACDDLLPAYGIEASRFDSELAEACRVGLVAALSRKG